jgi:hypothetical protein
MKARQELNRSTAFLIFGVVAALLIANPGAAQTAVSSWTAWFGCWEPVAPNAETDVAATCLLSVFSA